ncbi:putative pentatricopeptide repeat-containing protein At2g01510 [Brachypodium distachyon]|uniref:putative pentatricopeptide repeat-containing protein At2g01510 n=1 Tax=Brachypodium distachyon TaxID=15368 RepID=UPI000D0CF838|nr:putative pentatricopeptide repeat-containing protein At2g01510 [Brachypodium distachyon]|eukprot:XP_024311868.1 putative pentatricopeptide repeat-containing protein At2g01510 [Brachypodium distachyon]
MLSGYSRSGQIAAAHSFFLSSPPRLRDAVIWTVMMGALAAAPGRATDAVSLFRDMLREGVSPDGVCVSTVLNVPVAAYSTTASLHPFAVKLGLSSSVVVCNTLLDAYCKHGLLAAGWRVFDETPRRDAVTYNAMHDNGLLQGGAARGSAGPVRRYAPCWPWRHPVHLLQHARRGHGRWRHPSRPPGPRPRCQSRLGVQCVRQQLAAGFILQMCDCIGEMEKLFDEMPERDTVSYNVVIAGYAWSRCAGTVLRLFREMQVLGFDRQAWPYATLLSFAGSLPHIGIGKQIHAQLVLLGLSSEDLVGNALIDMYTKYGMLDAAKTNFAKKNDKTGVSWTAMITGHVQNGQQEEALQFFRDMRRAGVSPDRATFSSIIKASSSLAMIGLGRQLHSYLIRSGHMASVFSGSALLDMYAKCGCLNEALRTFDEMPERNSISWNAVISAYAHYGQAKNAIKMFEGMLRYGFKPDAVTFLSVLIHGNQDLARVAAEKLFSIGPTDATPYVILSNLYVKAGKWEDAARVKKAMRDRGLRKESGYSWVEFKQKIYSFSSNDQTNPMIAEIKDKLERLYKEMDKQGYKPDTSCALHQVDDDLKLESLKYHSERLAIAFALINTPPGRPIRVMKNLSACLDCHAAIKMMSKIVNRDIIVRDSSRFHHFKDGVCSCGDYW